MKKTILSELIAFGLSILAIPQLPLASELSLRDFTITIPDGWVSASENELRDYEAKIKSTTGMTNSYVFGIQPKGRTAYFMEPPFILGGMKTDQKNTNEEIKAMADELNKHLQESDVSKELDSDNAVLKNVFNTSSFGKPYFDKKTNCIWSTMSTQTPAFGLLHALTIQQLSPYGKIVLNAYVSDGTKDKYVVSIR